MFTSIQIQTIHKCNLKCDFCPNSKIEQSGELMTWNLYHRIINELKELKYNGKIGLFLMNESLLDNRLSNMVMLAKQNMPKAEVYISTNGTRLNEGMFEELKIAGIDRIMVSCYTESIYNRVKNWDVTPLKFYERNLKGQFYNRGGNSEGYGGAVVQKYCKHPFAQMYITSNGKAVLCCSDYKREVIMGDVNKDSLKDIWDNDKYDYYRKHLKQGNRKVLKLCKHCNY